MSATIPPMPRVRAPIQPIGRYLRIGHTGHRRLETLQGNGRLLARHVVVQASKLKCQKYLIGALEAAGAEIVPETEAA